MKTTVFFATLLCLELVSSYPFPEPLPSYYGSYEPVGVPEQRVISQPIQLSNLAHSQNSEFAYQQQQLAYLQQENLRRQNYKNLVRNLEQQQQAALNQRIASQLLIPPQPEPNYNSPLPLNTVREPYINSIPLQRPIQQPQYEAPITQQYYQNQQFTEPYQTVEAPQQFHLPNAEPQTVAKSASPVLPSYQNNQQVQPVPRYKPQNVLYDPRIQQALAARPINVKKRYLVLHPNGTVEHIDKIEHIAQRYPNYVLVNAGELPNPSESVTPGPIQPVAPVAPLDLGIVTNEASASVAPVAPLTPVVPSTPDAPSPDQPVSTTPAPRGPPSILNGTVPGPKPTVPPPTGPTTTTKTVSAPSALPPFVTAPATAVWTPVNPEITTPLPPTTTWNPTVTPPVDSTTTIPSETTENPAVTTPAPVTATANAVYPLPSDDVTTTSTTNIDSPVTTENPVIPAPEASATVIEDDSQSTIVTSVENQSNANVTVTESTDLTRSDLSFDKIPTEPIVWFRSTDVDFFDKITSGNETFDIVYFFNVPREPRLFKDTKTTIHANGTVVEEITETIYDDEDAPPRVIKTTKITNLDDSQPTT